MANDNSDAPLKTVNMRDEYPSSFEDLADLVGRIGVDAVRMMLNQIEREEV